MREIRMLRARWRGLETEPRTSLHGHEGGNPGYSQGMPYGQPRQPSTLPGDLPLRFHFPLPIPQPLTSDREVGKTLLKYPLRLPR